MSRLSYFAIQIQSWIFKTQSTSNHGPKSLSNLKTKFKNSSKNCNSLNGVNVSFRVSLFSWEWILSRSPRHFAFGHGHY